MKEAGIEIVTPKLGAQAVIGAGGRQRVGRAESAVDDETPRRFVGRRRHCRADINPVAAGILGGIEARVGGTEELGKGDGADEGRTTDADRQRLVDTGGPRIDVVDLRADALGHGGRFAAVGTGKEHGELLAADTADEISIAEAAADAGGDPQGTARP